MVIGIDPAELEKPMENARAFQQRHQLTYPILIDPDHQVMAAYRLMGTPFNTLIDRSGRVRYLDTGFDPAALDAALHELLAEQPG